MAFGHSALDYAVVLIVFLMTLKMLAGQPSRLLIWLPTFLTVDFFIEFGTQVTPSRFVPFMLGGWLLLCGRLNPDARHRAIVWLLAVSIFVSTIVAVQDANVTVRSLFRSLHYLSLILVFIFYTKVTKSREMVDLALWGLVVAGAIHGIYAVYQLIAASTGLPFRYIVYNSSGGTSDVWYGFLRVNGFADEPKRLGYVLLTGALATLYMLRHKFRSSMPVPFQSFRSYLVSPTILSTVIIMCLVTSLMTFSTSYFLAVLLTAAVSALWFPGRTLTIGLIVTAVFAIGASAFPQKTGAFIDQALELIEARSEELQSGRNSNAIYRQEHYAEALVKEEPLLIVSGLGMGSYNSVLFDRFGAGAGYSINGVLKPLNSQFFEVMFDLGIIGLLALYGGSAFLVLKVGRHSDVQYALCLVLLFLAIQSVMVDSKFYVAILMGISTTFVALRKKLGPIA